MNSPSGTNRRTVFAFRAVRRDERAKYDQARICQEFCHLAGAADILDPVRLREAEISIEPKAQIVVRFVLIGTTGHQRPINAT